MSDGKMAGKNFFPVKFNQSRGRVCLQEVSSVTLLFLAMSPEIHSPRLFSRNLPEHEGSYVIDIDWTCASASCLKRLY